MLATAGARISPCTGRFEAPSGATIRRMVCDIDAAHADTLVGAWLAQCVAAARAPQPPAAPGMIGSYLKACSGWTGWR